MEEAIDVFDVEVELENPAGNGPVNLNEVQQAEMRSPSRILTPQAIISPDSAESPHASSDAKGLSCAEMEEFIKAMGILSLKRDHETSVEIPGGARNNVSRISTPSWPNVDPVTHLANLFSQSRLSEMPDLIKEFQKSMHDDRYVQTKLKELINSESEKKSEVDVFEIMCKTIDVALFLQVDWARNSIYFRELKITDQMGLMIQSWSCILILDQLHERLHNDLPEEITLANGEIFSFLEVGVLGASNMLNQLALIASRLQELKFDTVDYLCLKFLLLLNPENMYSAGVKDLSSVKFLTKAYEQTQQVLMEYALSCYPQIPNKFYHLLQILPEIHSLSEKCEDFLYCHIKANYPLWSNLLTELLQARSRFHVLS